MMKYGMILAFLMLLSCGKDKEILLPKSNTTLVKDIEDISPIYILFQKKGNDTIAEVDKQTIISTTNWVFNVDKRLPLKQVLPEVIKLQNRKGQQSGKDKKENYYSYADSIGKNMAFIPFTQVVYSLEKQKEFEDQQAATLIVRFDKHNKLTCNGSDLKLSTFKESLQHFYSDKPIVIYLHFDKELPYEFYITDKIFLAGLKLNNVTFSAKEYVY
ncbi:MULTISPECIES: hypothetical protein [Flavobacterium]|uniref:hypothetical protein n=1 Tax=Flavobacterium TaxID=237 RepID=UPI000B0D15CF|nr:MULTISPECIES: hypothetical protein [Flavobacterium]